MVVLILLIVLTVLGLASLRGSLMEERMSAHMLDRSLAFQAAESALRYAEREVETASATGRSIGVDCSAGGVVCPATPPGIDTASAASCSAGVVGCWISVESKSSYSELAAAAPQYYIEYMGDVEVGGENAESDAGASANQYGGAPPIRGRSIYRISARSHDPRGERAVVALQATVELR